MSYHLFGIAFLVVAGGHGGNQTVEPIGARVTRLIKQLGHEEFTKREAAGKELDAIGEPALGPLRKAAAFSDDIEIRRRAGRLVEAISQPIRAAAVQKELAKWQGEWVADEGQKLSIKGEQWTSGTPTFGPVVGKLHDIEVQEAMTRVNLVVEAGPTKGLTCRIIFRRD